MPKHPLTTSQMSWLILTFLGFGYTWLNVFPLANRIRQPGTSAPASA